MSDTIFDYLFYTALTIFLLGLIYKISAWFTKNIGSSEKNIKPSHRAFYAANGLLGVIFSPKILLLLNAFLLDVLFQRRILKEDLGRWVAHMLIFYGFMLLLIMHALESVVTEAIFSDYYSTVNPFFFLRDFFGAMVIAGVILAALRRYVSKPRRLRTSRMDHYAIGIVALIMLSGIGLEGLKIASYSEFQMMVEDYAVAPAGDMLAVVVAAEGPSGMENRLYILPLTGDAVPSQVHPESAADRLLSPSFRP